MKIYFHIGQAKTGSSAIQSFLNYNRELLAKQYHILYPSFFTNNLAENSILHNHANFFHKLHESDAQDKYADFADCLQYSVQHGINRIVFSAEMFEFEWLPILIKEVSAVYKFDYTIILYLRRQDYYLEAAWKQWGHNIHNINTIQDYSKRVHLDFYSTIQLWLQHIPPEKFIIRPYEKSVIGENIVMDFMRLLGVDSLIDFTDPPDNNLNKNHGLSNDVIEILRQCKSPEADIHNNVLLDFVSNALSNRYKKTPMISYNLLSPGERIKIIEQYVESNNKIASIFWGENAVLFKDPLPDPNESWEPYSGLTLENTIPIFMEILFKLNDDISQVEQSSQINKSIFRFAGKDLFQNSKFNKQIVNKNLINDEIHFESRNDDPIIILPKINIPSNYVTLKIEISVPENTTIQLFYRTTLFCRFSEEKSIKMKSSVGRSIVVFKIYERNIYKRLRLDPGCHAGKYIIHKIEFCE
jgi:hypothetical protein